MSTIKQAAHNNLQALALLRDEIRLQAHLFRAELPGRWQALEQRWNTYNEQLALSRTAAAEAKPPIIAAIQLLEDTLRQEYAGFQDALRKQRSTLIS